MDKVLIIDTETTDANEGCEYIEIGYLELEAEGFYPPFARLANYVYKFKVIDEFRHLYPPTKPISLGALATHHIHIDDLEGCAPTGTFILPQGTTYIIGHNIDFDWRALGTPEVKRICTLALARKYMPELDSYTQSALLYHIKGKAAREDLRNAHSALADVKICLQILEHIIDNFLPDVTVEQLWEYSEIARVPVVMAFGKHKGERIKEDVPYGYKSWLLGQPDVDPYLQIALRR